MANKKISELNAIATPDSADVFPLVDVSAVETKKITFANLVTAIFNLQATTIGVATEQVTAVASGDNVTIDLTQLAYTFTAVQFVARNGQMLMPNGSASLPGSSWSRVGSTVTVYNAGDGDIYLIQYIHV